MITHWYLAGAGCECARVRHNCVCVRVYATCVWAYTPVCLHVCVCVTPPPLPWLPFEPTALQIPARVVQAVPGPGVKGEHRHHHDKGE